MGALIIGATVASTVWDVSRTRETIIENRMRELSHLSRALAEQTVRSVQAVDVVLRETALDEQFATPGRPANDRALYLRLRQNIAAMPQARELEILDTQGRIAYRSSEFPAEPGSRAGHDYFDLQRDNPGLGAYLSKAFRSQFDNAWTVALSRRIDGPDKSFLGVAVVTLDLRYFEKFYEAIGLPPGSAISLYQSDGVLLAHYPRAATAVGESFDMLPVFHELQTSTTFSSADFRTPLQGETELFVAQVVAGTPLIVGVGLSEQGALARWHRNTVHTSVRMLLLCASVALLIGLVIRQLRQQERAEGRLRESEERYALAMAGSNEGHWDWDLRLRKVYLSARTLAFLGQGSDDLVTGDDWFDRLGLVHPEDRARRKAALLGHLRGRTPHYECEYRVRDPSVGYRWLLDRGLGLRDDRGRTYRMAGAMMDITERKLAEAERTRLEQRLRQAEKLEALGRMAGGIAHDFNNILGAILGYGEMAVRAATEGSALKRYANNVMVAASRAKDLVDQILAFSRSSRGRRQAVDTRAVVDETLELVRASLPKNVRLQTELNVKDAQITGDPTHLHQVVMNLCTNAIQAMPSGGTLSVRLTAVETIADRPLSHGTLPAGHYLVLSVGDTGAGIPAQILDRIFEPFFTTKDPGAGTGLGLALVQGIVADLGGMIHVTSSTGAGSTFEVYLPRSGAPAEVADERPPLPRGRGQRVMLIDDEKPLLLLGEEMLAALGYDPAGFFDPHAALEALSAETSGFDAIIADYLMPMMTGTQFATRVRQLGLDMPIVLMSGYRGAALEQEARAARIEQILAKPLTFLDLAKAVERALEARAKVAS